MEPNTINIGGVTLRRLTLKQVEEVAALAYQKLGTTGKDLHAFGIVEKACYDLGIARRVVELACGDASKAEPVFQACQDADHFIHIAQVCIGAVPLMDEKQRYDYYRLDKPLHEVMGGGEKGVDAAHPTHSLGDSPPSGAN